MSAMSCGCRPCARQSWPGMTLVVRARPGRFGSDEVARVKDRVVTYLLRVLAIDTGRAVGLDVDQRGGQWRPERAVNRAVTG